MRRRDSKAGAKSPAEVEHLDPAYSSIEEHRTDIAARERHFAEIEAALQHRTEVIGAGIARLFRNADAGAIRRLAERYAGMAPAEPFPLANPPGEREKRPTPVEVRNQIVALRDAAAWTVTRKRQSSSRLMKAAAGMTPDALAQLSRPKRDVEPKAFDAPTGLALWAKVRAAGGDVPEVDPAILLADAEAALHRLGDARTKPGPKPSIAPVSIALMLIHDLSRLSGRQENRAVDGRYDNRVSDVLAVIFRECGINASAIEACRDAAEIDPLRKPRKRRRTHPDTTTKL